MTNGQAFDFKFKTPNRITVLLKLTITTSVNNQSVIYDPDTIKNTLIANILANYSIGKDFEPQKYYSLANAPWASIVKLEWSTNGGTTWNNTIYTAAYDDLFTILLANLTLVQV